MGFNMNNENNKNKNQINAYDFVGFPDRQLRDEAGQIFDVEKLRLISIKDESLITFDPYLEQYDIWMHHINNFCSRLQLHFLLMYYQYRQESLDIINFKEFASPKGAHKIFFDTFAEDTSLYLISYFDKHLEMFNDLYNIKIKLRSKRNISRNKILQKMEKIDALKEIAKEYRAVTKSEAFLYINSIRNDFVHNKSRSYCGMNIDKRIDKKNFKMNNESYNDIGIYVGIEYGYYNSEGISTNKTYNAICNLLKEYEQLCEKVNNFFNTQISFIIQEETASDIGLAYLNNRTTINPLK